MLGERLAEQLRFLLAHQPVVDVDAGQPVADRPVDEGGRHGRVHATRERADHEPVRADSRGVGVDPGAGCRPTVRSMKFAGVQVGLGAGDPDDEVAEDVAAARRVDDLGVELDAVEVARRRRRGPANGDESVWAVARKPLGRRVIESPWLIQTGWSRSRPVEEPVVGR